MLNQRETFCFCVIVIRVLLGKSVLYLKGRTVNGGRNLIWGLEHVQVTIYM
jgi:hypothetical protein